MTKTEAEELVQRAVEMVVARDETGTNTYHHAEMVIRMLTRDVQETLRWCILKLDLIPRRHVDIDDLIAFLTEVIGDLASDSLKPQQTEGDLCIV